MFSSHLRSQLARKYRLQHFLAFTDRSKEALWSFTAFLLFTAVISYFTAHFLLFITGYYNHPIATMIIHHVK